MTDEPRALAYWLDPQLAAANSTTESALRVMASNYGQRRGTTTTLLALAGAALVAGVALVIVGSADAGAGLGAAAAALFGTAALLRRRWVHRALDTRVVAASRAPQTMGSAWGLWAAPGVVLAAVALVEVLRNPDYAPSADFALFAVVVLGVLAIVLFIPAWHIEHERRLFRELVAGRPDLRVELDRMAARWEDPVRPFGPL